jgi:glycosyltransferase involved in cell wall biosynthesis
MSAYCTETQNQTVLLHLPRVLVVAPIKFNQETGSGVTSGNFFRGWPLQSIAQIHSDLHTTPDVTICEKYYFIPKSVIAGAGPLQLLIAKLVQFMGLFAPFQPLLAQLPPWNRIWQWAERFSPDILFARPTENPVFYSWFCRQLAARLKIPYVTCIFDDWFSRLNNQDGSAGRFLLRRHLQKNFKILLNGSSANLVISKEMSEAFERRYGKQFLTFSNCVDLSHWKATRKSYGASGVFSIVYAGAVSQDKELSSLIDIRDAVISLVGDGISVCLTIYGPSLWEKNIQEHLVRPPYVSYGGYFPPEKKPLVLSEADLLVLPINFDGPSLAYVGYSFQTKFPEYMASGTPILIYAPASSPNVRYALQENCAEIVDKPGAHLVKRAILNLMLNQEKRAVLGQRARKLAFTDHNAETVRKRFRDLLIQVSQSGTKRESS